jgi:hypothetical protein
MEFTTYLYITIGDYGISMIALCFLGIFCFMTGISTPVHLPSYVTLRRFCSGGLASTSTSAQARLGQLTLLTTSGQWPKDRP